MILVGVVVGAVAGCAPPGLVEGAIGGKEFPRVEGGYTTSWDPSGSFEMFDVGTADTVRQVTLVDYADACAVDSARYAARTGLIEEFLSAGGDRESLVADLEEADAGGKFWRLDVFTNQGVATTLADLDQTQTSFVPESGMASVVHATGAPDWEAVLAGGAPGGAWEVFTAREGSVEFTASGKNMDLWGKGSFALEDAAGESVGSIDVRFGVEVCVEVGDQRVAFEAAAAELEGG